MTSISGFHVKDDSMGGKPSKGTKADKRLKANKTAKTSRKAKKLGRRVA